MSTIKVKTFIEALQFTHLDHKKFKSYFNDKRITNAEKKILHCWNLLKDNYFDEILEILSTLKGVSDELVEAQKFFLRGMALNNSSRNDEALPFVLRAHKIIMKYPLPDQHFFVSHNLFIIYLNLKNEKGMKYALNSLLGLEDLKTKQQICVLQSEFALASFQNDMARANQLWDKIEAQKSEMSDLSYMVYLVAKYMHFVKLEKFEKCFEAMEEMKECRNFKSSNNYFYMKMMLEHYLENKPLYAYAQKFAKDPFLFHQIKVISSLEEHDLVSAQKHWQELNLRSPDVYQNDFQYAGDKCIFSLCLGKYSELLKPQEKKTAAVSGGKEEALYAILSHSTLPIRKEAIYLQVWGKELESKEDLMKLKKSISRIRQKYNVDIEFKKGCYLLIKKESKAS